MAPPAGGPAPGPSGAPAPTAPDHWTERLSRYVGDWTQWIKNAVGDTSIGILRGLKEGWDADSRSEALKSQHMQQVSETLRIMPPKMRELLEEAFVKQPWEHPTLTELAPLFQLDTWSRAFETPNIFDQTKEPVVPMASLNDGPLGLIRSIDAIERKKLFFDYFQAIVPPEVGHVRDYQSDEAKRAMEAYHRIVEGRNQKEKIDYLFDDAHGDRLQKAQSTMGGVLGREDMLPTATGNPDAYLIARSALNEHYWRSGVREIDGTVLPIQYEPYRGRMPDGTLRDFANGPKVGLFGDVADAIGDGARGTDAEDLKKNLRPSFLKGALAMGVIDQADLAQIETVLSNRAADALRVKADRRNEYLELSGVVRSEKAREAMNVYEAFSNMSGWEKLALIGAGVYLASQLPGWTAAGAVLYFGTKIFANKDILLDTISPLAKKVVSFGPNLGTSPMDSKEALQRIDLMQKFLSVHAKKDLDSATTGFSVLGDMKLQHLQASLILGSDDGTMPLTATLDTGSAAFSFLRSSLRGRGVRSGAQNFFFEGEQKIVEDPILHLETTFKDRKGKALITDEEMKNAMKTVPFNKNLLDAGNALMVVFYKVAAKKDEYRDIAARIEQARKEEGDGTYESLPPNSRVVRGVRFNARKDFMFLVRKGMEDPPDQTLMEFVQQETNIAGVTAPYVGPPGPSVSAPTLPGISPGTPPVLPGTPPAGTAVPPAIPPAGTAVPPSTPPSGPATTPSPAPGGTPVPPGTPPSGPATAPTPAPSGTPVPPAAPSTGPATPPAAPRGSVPVPPAISPAGPATGPGTGGAPSVPPGAPPPGPTVGPGTGSGTPAPSSGPSIGPATGPGTGGAPSVPPSVPPSGSSTGPSTGPAPKP